MNQEEVLLTVIVPIYNMEGYLRQCLDSLSNQSQKNMQILLIDDGSVDGSARICDEYQKKDPRMQAFHKKNG
ncbi:MAG TPA: hypothetical protein DHN33_04315 [Eubacteriaceae bacterium]|nr:hypothetical protein [Eubacteriaceae bacterium]